MIITYSKKQSDKNEEIERKRVSFLQNLKRIGIEYEEVVGKDFSQSSFNRNENNNNEEENERLIRFLKVNICEIMHVQKAGDSMTSGPLWQGWAPCRAQNIRAKNWLKNFPTG